MFASALFADVQFVGTPNSNRLTTCRCTDGHLFLTHHMGSLALGSLSAKHASFHEYAFFITLLSFMVIDTALHAGTLQGVKHIEKLLGLLAGCCAAAQSRQQSVADSLHP